MWRQLASHPVRTTAIISAIAMCVSWVIAILVYLAIPGIDVGLHFTLSTVMPAIMTPLTIFPLAMANQRLEKLKHLLQAQARTDALTGLPNRRHFFEYARAAAKRLEDFGGENAVFMIDIDRFKDINDNFGHDAGDAVLRAVACTLSDAVLSGTVSQSIVARIGGEEFAVLVEDMDDTEAVVLAGQICARVRETWTNYRSHALARSVSVGISSWHPNESIDNALARADDAVYEAKRTGRDRWCNDAGKDARLAGNDRFPVAQPAGSNYPKDLCNAPAYTPAHSIR